MGSPRTFCLAAPTTRAGQGVPARGPPDCADGQQNSINVIEPFESGGRVRIGQREDVTVEPEGGGGVAVTEPVLGLQDVSSRHQGRRNGVPERVERHLGVAGLVDSSANQWPRQDVVSRVV